MQLINCIKRDYANAEINKCSESGCKLKLNSLSNKIILKGEKICRNRKICDCIIVTGNVIGIIELKSKVKHINAIFEKFVNGKDIVLDILKKYNKNQNDFKFHYILLHKGISPSEFKLLTNRRIIVRGRKHYIMPKKCGYIFSKII